MSHEWLPHLSYLHYRRLLHILHLFSFEVLIVLAVVTATADVDASKVYGVDEVEAVQDGIAHDAL
jgi:hypothetical protein